MNQILTWTLLTLLLVLNIFQASTIANYHQQVQEWQALFARSQIQTEQALAAWDHCRQQTRRLLFP